MQLLAGESMVLPPVRKHWIVLVSALVWPVVVGLLLAIVAIVAGVTTASRQRVDVGPVQPGTILLLGACVLVVLVLASVLGLEWPRARVAESGPGCGGWTAILIGLVVLTVVLRFLFGAAVELVLALLSSAAIVGYAAWWAWL